MLGTVRLMTTVIMGVRSHDYSGFFCNEIGSIPSAFLINSSDVVSRCLYYDIKSYNLALILVLINNTHLETTAMIHSHLPRFGIISFVFFFKAVCSSGNKGENDHDVRFPRY